VLALILCNLAALDGVHLAEALGLPCIALSPGLVPYFLPANFLKQLQSTTPHLYTALQDCQPGVQQDPCSALLTALLACLYAMSLLTHAAWYMRQSQCE